MLFQKGQQEKRQPIARLHPAQDCQRGSLAAEHPWGSDPKMLSARQQPVRDTVIYSEDRPTGTLQPSHLKGLPPGSWLEVSGCVPVLSSPPTPTPWLKHGLKAQIYTESMC